MIKFNTRSDFDPTKVRRAFDNPKTDAVIYAKCVEIRTLAQIIATTQIKHTHLVTLPAYVASFSIDRIRTVTGNRFIVRNSDPAAFWVEFGAYLHDVNHPQILKYKPLTRATDIVGAAE